MKWFYKFYVFLFSWDVDIFVGWREWLLLECWPDEFCSDILDNSELNFLTWVSLNSVFISYVSLFGQFVCSFPGFSNCLLDHSVCSQNKVYSYPWSRPWKYKSGLFYHLKIIFIRMFIVLLVISVKIRNNIHSHNIIFLNALWLSRLFLLHRDFECCHLCLKPLFSFLS